MNIQRLPVKCMVLIALGLIMGMQFWAQVKDAAAAEVGYIDTHNHAPMNDTCNYDVLVDSDGDGILDMSYDSYVRTVVLANMGTYGIDLTLFMPEPHGVDNAPSCKYEHLAEIVKRYPERFAMLLGGETLNVMIQQVVKEGAPLEEIRLQFEQREEEILEAGAVGFGEMAAEHFSLASNHPYVSAPPDHPLFKDLADIAALYDVPIDLHMEALTSDLEFAYLPDCSTLYKQSQLNGGSHFNDPDVFPENITAFKTLVDYNPNAKIIWVHAGWDNTGQRTASLTGDLLQAHSNLYIQLRPLPSKSLACNPINHFDENNEIYIDGDWLTLIETYPDRFIVGLDSFYSNIFPNLSYKEFIELLQADLKAGQGFMKKLNERSSDLARKVGRDNAVGIYKLGGQIQFSSPSYGVDEGIGNATITVQRTGFTIRSVTVDYAISDGTATAGVDYDVVATNGTLTFAAGETTKTLTVSIVNDNVVENTEAVFLTLSNPTGGATLGSVDAAVLTIANNDVAFRFVSASYGVSEAGGMATITVEKLGGTPEIVSVDYATSDGTAKAGTDYQATSGTLTFVPGESGVKIFEVPIVNNTLPDAHRTVNLALSNPTNSNGSASLTTPSTAVLTILNDDFINTPSGTNVLVDLTPVSVTFANVTESGVTSLTSSDTGPNPLSGFQFGDSPTYYEITTTAVYSGSITVCINYTGISFVGSEEDLRLYHLEGGLWVDHTVLPVDTAKNIICASVTSLSPFAIFEPIPIPVAIDVKPGSFPNSINLGSGGTVAVAIFSAQTFDARSVDPTTVTLASAPVKLKGKGTPMASFEDVNSDGLVDLVVHVSTEALELSETDTEAVLRGKTSDGRVIKGTDSVRVVP